ncbi:hypothetical protein, partial [Palleronia rufa]|uniref:hypothetical protein n=1 Tax=Palleronia rufa TaxID=1530186 RepID=UPI0039EE4D2B
MLAPVSSTGNQAAFPGRFKTRKWRDLALLRKDWVRDSSRESSVVAVLHEQTDPAELQDKELAGLQR